VTVTTVSLKVPHQDCLGAGGPPCSGPHLEALRPHTSRVRTSGRYLSLMISCQTLGPVGLSVDGAPAPPELLWRKHLALLVYLARSPRGRTREHLIGLLWPEKPEAAARHSLNEAIRVMRRYLGESSVDTGAGQVRLGADAVWLDVDRLEELAAAGEWEDAARLIAGEFLEGFAIAGASEFEDWLANERSAVRLRSVDVLVHHADDLLRAGQASEATAVVVRALGLDPASGQAMRVAMRSMVLAGDRAGALERYDAFADRLKQEIGTSRCRNRGAGRAGAPRAVHPPSAAGEGKRPERRRAPAAPRGS
jgi:DNA-binding SARP family transcriptional activator